MDATAPAALRLAVLAAGCAQYQHRPLDESAILAQLRGPPLQALETPARERRGMRFDLSESLAPDQAVTIALTYNPDLRAARRERGIAEGQIVAASAISNPTIEVELLHVQAQLMSWRFTLQWELPRPGVWSAGRAQARARLSEVEAEIAEREWVLATAVRTAHAALLSVQEQVKLVETALAVRRKIVELVNRRMVHGSSTRFDADAATLALAQVMQERDGLEVERVSALQNLQRLLGVGPDRPLVLQPGPEPRLLTADGNPLDPRALETRALAARPALRAARARYQQREQVLRLETARSWPWFRLIEAPRLTSSPSANTNRSDWDLGVELLLPLTDWNSGPILVAEAARAREADAFVAQLEDLRRDIRLAVAEIETRARRLRRFEEVVLPALDEHDRLMELAFRAQQLDLIAVLHAEELVLRNRRDYLAARFDYQKAWLALDAVVGEAVSREWH